MQESLSRAVLNETIRRGILTAVAVVGVDVNYLMQNRKREGLMSLIGISGTLRSNLLNNRVSFLKELKELCHDEIEYNNAVTYFRILPGLYPGDTSILDSTPVHPRNYDIARILCSKVSGSIEEALKSKELLRGISSREISEAEETDASVSSIHKSLMHGERPVYTGLLDHLVFKELGGDETLVGRTVEGRVVKCGETFYLLSLESSSIMVYVRKISNSELFLNQLVMVRIESVNDFLLSYTGSAAVEEKPRTKYPRFATHPLFRNHDSSEAEEYLRENSLSLTLRRSGRDGSPILVLKVLDDVYIHMKIQESDKYSYREQEYEDLDELVTKVAKKILSNVKAIKSHKYYFDSEGGASEYIDQGGSYIRYGFYFSRKYPGKLCLLYRAGRDCKEYISIGETLGYEGREFKDLDEFMRYRKSV